ncbi:hypothetical protein DFH09DRAFT_1086965 [Mycena vulgaris]|nr:hypothetical protein DFH09DRAFT_1086965 [Mycena vulgaris]
MSPTPNPSAKLAVLHATNLTPRRLSPPRSTPLRPATRLSQSFRILWWMPNLAFSTIASQPLNGMLRKLNANLRRRGTANTTERPSATARPLPLHAQNARASCVTSCDVDGDLYEVACWRPEMIRAPLAETIWAPLAETKSKPEVDRPSSRMGKGRKRKQSSSEQSNKLSRRCTPLGKECSVRAERSVDHHSVTSVSVGAGAQPASMAIEDPHLSSPPASPGLDTIDVDPPEPPPDEDLQLPKRFIYAT